MASVPIQHYQSTGLLVNTSQNQFLVFLEGNNTFAQQDQLPLLSKGHYIQHVQIL